MKLHWSLTSVALALLLLLTGCAQPEQAAEPSTRLLLPEDIYVEAARQGAVVYRISSQDSIVLVHVGRDGKLKSLGHDHVVASEDVQGLVMLPDDIDASRADLLVPLQRLIVDKPEHRALIGLDSEMPESAIEGTTSNMQEKVLESESFPWVQIRARFASAQTAPPTLDVSMSMHGTSFDYVIPVDLQIEPDRLIIKGKMTVRHADFELEPFSAAGGLLKVAEQLDLQFKLIAHRI